MKTYIHKELWKEIRSISGYYAYHEERLIQFRNREILIAVGCGMVDNSCCGTGGCRFIDVAGYVRSWKSGIDKHGNYISMVDRIEGDENIKMIEKMLAIAYPHARINFD